MLSLLTSFFRAALCLFQYLRSPVFGLKNAWVAERVVRLMAWLTWHRELQHITELAHLISSLISPHITATLHVKRCSRGLTSKIIMGFLNWDFLIKTGNFKGTLYNSIHKYFIIFKAELNDTCVKIKNLILVVLISHKVRSEENGQQTQLTCSTSIGSR